MTNDPLSLALQKLTDVQRKAVEWKDGSILVLAGPGSGKTQVLTCRIACLLDSSREKNFRVLALTFTNKAADEMKGRVASFVPGLEERANIGTFHSFCGQVLRQHGVHIGIKSDFAIYSRFDDRSAIFKDALARAASEGEILRTEDVRYLGPIDQMKARLIEPEEIKTSLSRSADAERIARAYSVYEEELRRLNVLDFNSLIFEAYRLVKKFPAIAARYRRSHPYWLFDEFQDTNHAQYKLIRAMAGKEFRNIFAVADDDQIIYEWNGASFRQIQRLRKDFSAELIQLPTNYRCPPSIVEAANCLVAYNIQRTETKKPLVAGKKDFKFPEREHITVYNFNSEDEEADWIAKEIKEHDSNSWGRITVLARTRALLRRMRNALLEENVRTVIAQRRDDFLSPEFRWLVACITQIVRPLDRRNIGVLVEAYNRIVEIDIAVDQVITDAEVTGKSYFSIWLEEAVHKARISWQKELLELVKHLSFSPLASKNTIEDIINVFSLSLTGGEVEPPDFSEDLNAWREIYREITKHYGKNIQLDQFLQELQLRSKEPAPDSKTVTLMTVHAAKGREFDIVYVIGLAEDIMPSYQSRKKGDNSPEMEEERRNCFVAITRTKECLVLSWANQYSGFSKEPSRFLVEMNLV